MATEREIVLGRVIPDKVNILGVPVSAIDMAMAVDVIDGWIEDRRSNFVCIRDVHGIMASQDDEAYKRIHNRAGMVGPRPHAVERNEMYSAIIAGYFARHRVKPGITGWAQVNGLRGETDAPDKMEAWVEHDVYYIENWSLLFDLQILAMTANVVFGQESAY